jgi:hypothetical protein
MSGENELDYALAQQNLETGEGEETEDSNLLFTNPGGDRSAQDSVAWQDTVAAMFAEINLKKHIAIFSPGEGQVVNLVNIMEKNESAAGFIMSAAIWQVLNGPFGLEKTFVVPGTNIKSTLRKVFGESMPRASWHLFLKEVEALVHLELGDNLSRHLGPVLTGHGTYPTFQPEPKRQQTPQERARGWAKIGLAADGQTPLVQGSRQPATGTPSRVLPQATVRPSTTRAPISPVRGTGRGNRSGFMGGLSTFYGQK